MGLQLLKHFPLATPTKRRRRPCLLPLPVGMLRTGTGLQRRAEQHAPRSRHPPRASVLCGRLRAARLPRARALPPALPPQAGAHRPARSGRSAEHEAKWPWHCSTALRASVQQGASGKTWKAVRRVKREHEGVERQAMEGRISGQNLRSGTHSAGRESCTRCRDVRGQRRVRDDGHLHRAQPRPCREGGGQEQRASATRRTMLQWGAALRVHLSSKGCSSPVIMGTVRCIQACA